MYSGFVLYLGPLWMDVVRSAFYLNVLFVLACHD